jgi:dihydroorotase
MQHLAQYTDIATVEVTPQHLTLHAPDCYDRLGSLAQMNPPIREERHQQALWRALQSGLVTVIGSDHAPHTREEKARPYPKSPSGLPGVQTLLPLMLHHVNQGRLSLNRLVELVCHAPARIYGMVGKGWLETGFDGDLTLVDMNARKTITHAQMASRCGWTPFDGMEVHGWPTATIVRGHIVMRDGELQGGPSGLPMRFVAPDIEDL